MTRLENCRIIMNSINEELRRSGYLTYPYHDKEFSIRHKILDKINNVVKKCGLYASFRNNQIEHCGANVKKDNICICDENDGLMLGGSINYYSNGLANDSWSSYYVTVSIWPIVIQHKNI